MPRLLTSRFSLRLVLTVAVTVCGLTLNPAAGQAQTDDAEALFGEGNALLARALRSRGDRRRQALRDARAAYLEVVRSGARTRNVVFNLGLVAQELEELDEAFNYFAEYVRAFELTPSDREAGLQRLDALRSRVAVVSIQSEPTGAEVRVDRRDLPPRGTTPLLLALPTGPHRLLFSLDGHEPTEEEVNVVLGQTVEAIGALPASAVDVQFLAPANGTLTLDEEPIVAGRAVAVSPGAHVVRLRVPGHESPVERRFEVLPRSAPMVIELSAPSSPGDLRGHVAVRADVAARVFVDGTLVGEGTVVEVDAPQGPHLVRVEADERTPVERRITLGRDALSLNGVLGRSAQNDGIFAGRLAFGIGAGVSLLTTVVMGTLSLGLSNEWNSDLQDHNANPRPESEAALLRAADELDQHLLATDILIGLTAAMTATTIVFFVLPSRDEAPSRLEIGLSPTFGGAALTARGAMGGSW